MEKKRFTNKQKELIYFILEKSEKKYSIMEIEKIISLIYEEKSDELKKMLSKEKKEILNAILSVSKENLKELEYGPKEEKETHFFSKEGYKKPEVLEKKIEDSEIITKENFEKHPAHFKYVAYLLNQLDQKYHESNLRLNLRKTFLGEDETSHTYHGVKMFNTYLDEKNTNGVFPQKNQLLRKDFSDDELIRITNSLIASLRDYYYQDFLGLKNYEKYILKKSDSDDEKRKKIRQLRFLDAPITSQYGEFGVPADFIFKKLKQMQELNIPFSEETLMDHVEQEIFTPMIDRHRSETKEKILNTFLTNKNFYQFQHFMDRQVKENPDIPDLYKEQIRKLYTEKNLDAAKKVFSHFVPKGMGNYNTDRKQEFELMKKMYEEHNKEKKDEKTKHYFIDVENKEQNYKKAA